MPKPAFRISDAVALLILAAASILGINQYTFGVYNHCITIPFIKSLLNPELYRDDYLIAELQYFYSLFLPACAFLIKLLHASLPSMFFALYAASLCFTLAAFFLIALKLFNRREVAYFSVMFLVFSLNTIGKEQTIANLLMERTLALPLLLFAFYAAFSKQFNMAALLCGIAFLIHPLSASYVIIILMACLSDHALRERRLKDFLLAAGILGAVISPLIILKLMNPAPELHLLMAKQEWIDLLRVRSSYHVFPSTWSILALLQALALVIGFLMAWKHKPQQNHHRIVKTSFAVMLGLFAVGTIFTEIFPVSIIIQFQLFRCFKFLVFFAILYYANYIFTEPDTLSGIAGKMLLTALIITGYAQESLTVVAGLLLLIATATIGLHLLNKTAADGRKYLVPLQLMFLLAIGVAGSLNRVQFSINNAQEKSWLDVQQWAKQNTPANAAFIAPPYLEGFRVESERMLYGEWKDGTQMFFDPPFGSEWMRRMKMLGYDESKLLSDSYKELKEGGFIMIANEMMAGENSKVYAVVPLEMATLRFPKVYSNGKFSVYEIRSVEVAEFNLVEDGSHELVAQTAEVGD